MAQAPEQPEPVFGWRATLFALVFVFAVVGGFGLATAAAQDDDAHGDKSEHSDDDHGDDDHDDE